MTASRAEKIVGFPFTCRLLPARTALPDGTKPMRAMWLCTGTHDVYGYPVVAYDERQELALKKFVDNNYREISRIVVLEQSHRCLGDGRKAVGMLQIDHIVMRSHGRRDTRENLRGLCDQCHAARHKSRDWQPQYTLEELSKIGQVRGF